MSAIHAHQAPGSRSARRSSSRRAGCKIARAVNLVIEQLEGRVLLSGTLPAAVHASTDAVYSVTGDPTSGYAVTLSAGTYSFDANEGAPGGDWQNLSLTLTGTADVSFNAPQTFTAFTLSATAKAAVSSSGGGVSGNLLDVAAGGFSMALDPVTGNPTATLDMMDNDMILRGPASGSGDDELPVLRTLLHSGLPTGGTGLRSSDVTESGTSYVTRLGYRDGLSTFDGQATINGQAVKASDTLVKYTLNGDMDLDGRVTNADFARFSNAFASPPAAGTSTWQLGDFNYDGRTTGSDYTLLSNDFGQNITGPNFARSILPVGLPVTATEGQPLTSAKLATFTDTHNATSQVTQATDYTASVSWGDGVFSPTNVTV
ncbi:MAG: hypothetical protein JWP03_4276, partial [Phycisphaerales bacterium]|nr:hypothetical protein [Phycisphaerales bacterium]